MFMRDDLPETILLRECKNLRRTGCADAAAAARVTQYACCASHNIPPSTFQGSGSALLCNPLKAVCIPLIYISTHIGYYRSNNVKYIISRNVECSDT